MFTTPPPPPAVASAPSASPFSLWTPRTHLFACCRPPTLPLLSSYTIISLLLLLLSRLPHPLPPRDSGARVTTLPPHSQCVLLFPPPTIFALSTACSRCRQHDDIAATSVMTSPPLLSPQPPPHRQKTTFSLGISMVGGGAMNRGAIAIGNTVVLLERSGGGRRNLIARSATRARSSSSRLAMARTTKTTTVTTMTTTTTTTTTRRR